MRPLNSDATPKYCVRPMQELTRPAISHDQITMSNSLLKPSFFNASTNNKTIAQSHENIKGAVAGDGPDANGLIQGNKTASVVIGTKIALDTMPKVIEKSSRSSWRDYQRQFRIFIFLQLAQSINCAEVILRAVQPAQDRKLPSCCFGRTVKTQRNRIPIT